MQKKIVAFSVLIISIFTSALSLDVGSGHYGYETLGVLTFNGHLTLQGTLIQDKLIVNGSLEASRAEIEKLHVKGRVTLKDSQINGKSEINGYLTAENSYFYGLLALKTHKLDLTDSLTYDILIRTSDNPGTSQIVTLKNTHVHGDIVFEAENGIVEKDEDSFIEGQILGGKLHLEE